MWYLVYTDKNKTSVKSLGHLDGKTLSTNSPVALFDTEAELEETVDRLMGEGYYASRIEPDIDPT